MALCDSLPGAPAQQSDRNPLIDLMTCSSIELSAHRPQDAWEIAKLLPFGTNVYVNHLPRHSLTDMLACIAAVYEAGLQPVPHLAARRIKSAQEVASFLECVVSEYGVRKALLIGGEAPTPVGPFEDGAALLRTGLLQECGISEVGLALYPEGHPNIPSPKLDDAFKTKISLAAEQGLAPYAVTQFSFAPSQIAECCVKLAQFAPDVALFIGVAGPTSPVRLLDYARRCGVSTSLRALTQNMNTMRTLTQTDPSKLLEKVIEECDARGVENVVGVHFFSFGGAAQTAKWINSYITGRE